MGLRDFWKLWKLHIWILEGGVSDLDWNKLSRKAIELLLAAVAILLLYRVGAPQSVIDGVAAVAITYLGFQGANDIVAKLQGSVKQGSVKSKKFWATVAGTMGISICGIVGAPDFVVELITKGLQIYVGVTGTVDLSGTIGAWLPKPPANGGA